MFIFEFKPMNNGYLCKPDVDFSEVDLVIPETYDDGENGEFPVVEVSDFNDKGIKSVHLPSGLIRINANTFNNNSIDSVTLGRNITFIGAGAFSNNNLTTIYYNPNIGNFVFGRFLNNSIKDIYLTPLNPEEEDKFYPLAGPINGNEGVFPITVTVPTSLYSEYTSDTNWDNAVNNGYINIVQSGEVPGTPNYVINKAPYEFEDAYMDISNFFTNEHITVTNNYEYNDIDGVFVIPVDSEIAMFEALSVGKYYAIDTGGYFSPQPFKAMIEFDIKEINTENKVLLLNSSEISMIVEEGGGEPSEVEYNFVYDPSRGGYLCTGPTEHWNGQVVDLKTFNSGVGEGWFDDGINGSAPIVGVGDNAFENTSVRDVYFSDHTAYIGNYAFANTSISHINLNAHHSDLQISPYSFNNSSITRIDFYNYSHGAISIGGSAFVDNPIQYIYMDDGVRISVNPSVFNRHGMSVSISKDDEDFYLNDSGWNFYVNNFDLTFNVRGGGSGKDFRELGKIYSIPSNSPFKGFNLVTQDTINRMLNKEEPAEDGYIYISNETVGGGGGGASSLSDLSDIKFELELQPDQVLVFNGSFWSNKQTTTMWGLQSRDTGVFEYSSFPVFYENYSINYLVVCSDNVTPEALEVGKTYYLNVSDASFYKFEITRNDTEEGTFTANRELWVRGSAIL